MLIHICRCCYFYHNTVKLRAKEWQESPCTHQPPNILHLSSHQTKQTLRQDAPRGPERAVHSVSKDQQQDETAEGKAESWKSPQLVRDFSTDPSGGDRVADKINHLLAVYREFKNHNWQTWPVWHIQDTTPKTVGSVFFARAQKTLLKTGCMLDHKASLNKFRRIKITQTMSPDQSRIKVEINNKKMTRNVFLMVWKFISRTLNNL